MAVEVIIPGMLTTVQDLGRYGYQQSGMTCSGVMDQQAYRKANYLVGNPETAAVLEFTVYGGSYRFTQDTVFALTGADMGAEIGEQPVETNRAVTAKQGDVLNLGMASMGCRTYLAVSGGFLVPLVMGSYATNIRCKMGGFHGRKLKRGDVLEIGQNSVSFSKIKNRKVSIPEYSGEVEVRVIPGPQEEMFTQKGLHTFYSGYYRVQEDSDRMGYRLDGSLIESKNGTDIVSDGITFGSIQVPASGKPIILMADHQTTGGYAKIGTVCRMDLSKVAQCKPGDRIHFKKIDVDKAQKLYKEMISKECF